MGSSYLTLGKIFSIPYDYNVQVMGSDLVWWRSNRVTIVKGNRRNGVGGSSPLGSSFFVFSLRENRNWQKRLRMRLRVKRRGCVTAVQFILFNFASYSPSIAMELKVSKQITCKWHKQKIETNKYVPWALFLKLQTAEINFEKRLGWLKEQF